MTTPFFSTGTARGGTGLVAQMLGANRAINIALDAYLPLYKSLLAALIRERGDDAIRKRYDPNAPIDDYYFADERIRTMDCIQGGDLDLPFCAEERPALSAALHQRTPLESADLVPFLDHLDDRTYLELFRRALEIVQRARPKPDVKWVGLHDNWGIDCFAPFARAFPEARFVIFLRDPRAVVASHLNVKDPTLIAQVLSYARHLRKYAAFTCQYQHEPLFAGRLHVLRYEDLILAPEDRARQLCEFFGVAFHPEMLDSERYVDRATGQVWNGLSSFEQAARGFRPHRIDRWRTMLPERVVKTVEFICGPEMRLFGYSPTSAADGQWPESEVLDFLLEDQEGYKKWRTDFGIPEYDVGAELFRKLLLCSSRLDFDARVIRRSFLFEAVFRCIKSQVLAPALT